LALAFCLGCGFSLADGGILLYGDVEAFPEDSLLDLSGKRISDAKDLLEKLPELSGVKEVRLGSPGLTFSQLKQLREAFPGIAFHWTMEQFGLELSSTDTAIDLGKRLVTRDSFDDFVTVLDCMPELTKVDMYSTGTNQKKNGVDIDFLAERYPRIRFGWTLRIGDHVVRTDAAAFSTHHSPKKQPYHKSGAFEPLKYCKDMLALDIGHNEVTDISFLEEMPQLKVLIIAINKIADITPLAKLTELEYLELFKNNVTDITPLANLTKLKDLNISFNLIEDYSPIYGLKGLERLWLYNSGATNKRKPLQPELKEAFAAALPDCTINDTSYPTSDGWRQHPRYTAVFRMFKHGVYIPFDE